MTPSKSVFVVDASAAVKIVFDEPGHAEYVAWRETHKDDLLLAPVLFFSETGRAIEKHVGDRRNIPTYHADVLADIQLEAPDRTTWDLSIPLTFYDAQYVQLARRTGATLVTADERMAREARAAGLDVLEIKPAQSP